MRFFKKKVPAAQAGRALACYHIDADRCWKAVCLLRSFKVPGPIATCEMAFARAAALKWAIKASRRNEAAKRAMLESVDAVVADAFDSEQDTPETLAHYRGRSLQEISHERVAFYEEHAFPSSSLAAVLGRVLGVPGPVSVEASFIFDEEIALANRQMAEIAIVA